jgi:hypothetical protein
LGKTRIVKSRDFTPFSFFLFAVELSQAHLTEFLLAHPDMLEQFVSENIDLGKNTS